MSDSLAALYQQVILDHARARHGHGVLEAPDAQRFEKDPTCGDEVTMQVSLDAGRIGAIAWTGEGCSISTASTSMLTEIALGKTPDELRALIGSFRGMLRSRGESIPDESLGDAVVFEGVSKYVMRIKCAMLGWVALEGCLADLDAREADAKSSAS